MIRVKSTNAALRIITRAEQLGMSAAWRYFFANGMPPVAHHLPPNVKWTARRDRLLRAYGVAGAFLEVAREAGYTQRDVEDYVNLTKAFADVKGLAYYLPLPAEYEAALFGMHGYRVFRCPVGEGHLFLAPRKATCPVHRTTIYHQRGKKPVTGP